MRKLRASIRSRGKSARRLILSLASRDHSTRFAVEALESRTLLAAVSWTGAAGDGQWTTPGNWSSNPALPGPGDDVTINVTGNPTITLGSGTQSIHSLTSADPITVSFPGTLAVATTVQLSANLTLAGGTLLGGTYAASAGASLITASTSTLNGVTLDAPFLLPVNGLHILNGLTLNSTLTLSASAGAFVIAEFDGTQTLSGTGQVIFAGAGNYDSLDPNENGSTSPVTLTIGSGITIQGAAGATAIGELEPNDGAQDLVVNQGTIDANVSGQVLQLGADIFNNQGTAEATASRAVLDIEPPQFIGSTALPIEPWTNSGTLAVSPGATIELDGSMTTAGLGLQGFHNTGGTVDLIGSLNNAGATLALNAATGSWNLDGCTITGGTLAASAGAAFFATNNSTIDGVSLNANLTVEDFANLDVKDNLVLNGVMTVTDADVTFLGTQLLSGTGQVVFGGTDEDSFQPSSGSDLSDGAVLTIGPQITMQCASTSTAFVFLEGLYAPDSVTNQGHINVNAAGVDLFVDSFFNQGSVVVSAGLFELDGTIPTSALGSISNTGGEVDITGTLDNTEATFALTAATGSWVLDGGTILGGTITTSGGASLAIADDPTLDGVTLATNLSVDIMTILDGLTFENNATIFLFESSSSPGELDFQSPAQTLGGNGNIIFDGFDGPTGADYITLAPPVQGGLAPAVGSSESLTIGPGVQIVTGDASGVIGSGIPGNLIINQGLISAQTRGTSITILDTLQNQGSGQVVQSNGASVTTGSGGTLTFSGGGTVNVNGAINGATVVITSGDVNFNSTTPVTLQSLTLSGGALDGTAPIFITGSATLSGGTMSGTGTTTFITGATATVSGSVVATRVLSNAGTVNVIAGRLELDGGGSQSGTFNLSGGTALVLGGTATQSFAAASAVTGLGTLQLQGSMSVALTGAYNVASTIVRDQAQVAFDANASTENLTATGGSIAIGASAANPTASGTAAPATTPTPVTLDVLNTSDLSGTSSYVIYPGATYMAGGPFLFISGSPAVYLDSDNAAPGKLLLGGAGLEVIGGSAAISSMGTGALPGQIDLGGGACTFSINASDQLSVLAQVTDGSLSNNGGGVLALISPNNYAGGTTIGAGTIQIGDPGALGSGPVTFSGGMLAPGAVGVVPYALNAATANASITVDVGTGSYQFPSASLGSALNVLGSGTLTITGTVTLPNAAAPTTVNTTAAVVFSGGITGGTGITLSGSGSLTFSGTAANAYAGTTTVNGGTLVLNKSGGAVAVPGTLSIVPFAGAGVATAATVRLLAGQQLSSGSTLNFDSTNGSATLDLNGFNQSVQSLTINNSGGVAVIGHGPTGAAAAGTLTVNSLAIASGQTLDLTGTNLQVSYTSGSDPVAAIRNYLSNGYGGGAWNGNGTAGGVGRIISSTAAAAGRTLGYADSVDKIVAGVAPNTILIKYTIPGDANLDGSVNFSDLVILAQHYGANATWDQGDFSYGGKVNFADLVALAQHYNKSVSSSAVAASASLTPAIETAAGTSDTSTRSRHRPLRHSRHRT